MILFFRAFEEISQHFKTRKKDEEFNNSLHLVADNNPLKFSSVKAKDIKEGDIIKIADKILPVDIMILSSTNDSIFISTT